MNDDGALLLAAWTHDVIGQGEAAAIRRRARLTQADVAGSLRVTPQAVQQWETGRRRPSTAHAIAYGQLLRALLDRARAPR